MSLTNTHRRVKGYTSPLREAQAQRTRELIVSAASRLFATRGYAGTSMDDIAAAAGVSRATVFNAVGGKAQLLKTALDVAIVGDDDPRSLPERERSRAIRAEPDPRRYLERYAAFVAEANGRVAPITEAMRGAAGADADARLVWTKHQAERRIGAANVVADVVNKGGLRRGVSRDEAADIVWVLIDATVYAQLVFERGWTPSRYESWLAATLKQQLVG